MYLHRLRCSRRFQEVYQSGLRFDGRYITVFIHQNQLSYDRCGFTVSRKISKKAVARNRIKRLLRETVRQSTVQNSSFGYYDWVINAKRSMLRVRLSDVVKDFQILTTSLTSQRSAAAVNQLAEETTSLHTDAL